MPDEDGPDEELTEAETQAYPVAEPRPQPPPPPPPPRKLVRSRSDRVLAGVCGGVAEYLGIDSVLVRIAALLLVFAGGAGLVLYLVGWIAMPEGPETETETIEGETPERPTAPSPERTAGTLLLGLVFVALGVFFLLDEIWPDFFSWQYVWPIALIAIGLAVLVRSRQ